MACAALAIPSLSHALACGDIVTSSVTLTEDLDCTGSGSWYALEIRGDGVVLHLNGHQILGDRSMQGVLVWESHGVRVFGPGRIGDFGIGVNAFQSPKLQMAGVEVSDGGAGVIVNRSPKSEVAYNEFYRLEGTAIQVMDPVAGSSVPSGQATILGNRIAKVAWGIHLCGVHAGNNRVQHNDIQATSSAGILLSDHSGGNRVLANTIHQSERAAIRVESSVGNTVVDNVISVASSGIELNAVRTGQCAGDPVLLHDNGGHKVYDNRLRRTQTAIRVGDGFALGKVADTVFLNTWIDEASIGLHFLPNSVGNVAWGSLFGAVTTPVIDEGVGNSW